MCIDSFSVGDYTVIIMNENHIVFEMRVLEDQ